MIYTYKMKNKKSETKMKLLSNSTELNIAKSAGAVEYTDCISAKGLDLLQQVFKMWH